MAGLTGVLRNTTASNGGSVELYIRGTNRDHDLPWGANYDTGKNISVFIQQINSHIFFVKDVKHVLISRDKSLTTC